MIDPQCDCGESLNTIANFDLALLYEFINWSVSPFLTALHGYFSLLFCLVAGSRAYEKYQKNIVNVEVGDFNAWFTAFYDLYLVY